MSTFLDDVDSRPGSTTSLLRTVIGLYLRDAGGWLPASVFLRLLAALDVPDAVGRTALSRLKKKAVLEQELRNGVPGYSLTADAGAMLSRGDHRIFEPQSMPDGGPWCLLSFSIPETEREKRHQLRRRLRWSGCGTVAPGLWIAPAFRQPGIEDVLAGLGLRSQATLFITETPLPGGSLRDAVAQWWDLDAIAATHLEFLRQSGESAGTAGRLSGQEALAAYVRCIDSWRVIPYLDPGLPAGCLPEDWPGHRSAAAFRAVTRALSASAAAYVRESLETGTTRAGAK